jgi:hypothetical protein
MIDRFLASLACNRSHKASILDLLSSGDLISSGDLLSLELSSTGIVAAGAGATGVVPVGGLAV